MLINSLSPVSTTNSVLVDRNTLQRAQAPASQQLNEISAHEAIVIANKIMRSLSNSLEFCLDPESGKVEVRVIDNETHQVIRQFPSEEMKAIARTIDHMQGLLINRNA